MPERGEARDVGRGDELDVLHARHQRRPADRRRQGVKRRPDRRVPDPVDLGGDPQRGRPRRLCPQLVGGTSQTP